MSEPMKLFNVRVKPPSEDYPHSSAQVGGRWFVCNQDTVVREDQLTEEIRNSELLIVTEIAPDPEPVAEVPPADPESPVVPPAEPDLSTDNNEAEVVREVNAVADEGGVLTELKETHKKRGR